MPDVAQFDALILCEFSATVRDALIRLGIRAISCDLLPSEQPGPHYQGDALEILYSRRWPLVIAHPPCTFLCSSGLHWNGRTPGRAEQTEASLRFVESIWKGPADAMLLENPQGRINTRLPFMPPAQYIQPYEFGHDASKKTGLWLRGLPPLIKDPAKFVQPRITAEGKKRWANQTDSGQNRLGPSETRAAERARTYQGIADAFAAQYGCYALRSAGA